MIGAIGIAEEKLNPSGYIRVRGELWKAEVVGNARPIERGDGVRIQETRGLTLLVSRADHEGER